MKRVNNQSTKLFSQVESWRRRLLDIGNRNPLINTSFNPTRGVLEFSHPVPEVVWQKLVVAGEAGSRSLRFPWKRDLVPPPVIEQAEHAGSALEPEVDCQTTTKEWNPSLAECLASSKVRPDDLLTILGDRVLDRRIRNLDGYAKLSISEQGIHCLFLVFGFIKWFENTDSTKEIRSPLILVPATLTRETSDSPWELQEAEDDVVDNQCLRQRFKQDFGLELPPLPELEHLEEDGARLAYLDEIRKAISKNERWEVEDRCCLGRFAFPKIAMWQDLGDHIQSIAASPICQAIGGQAVDDPQVAFGDASSVPDAEQLDDELKPGEIKAILDCDSSQLEAIVAARKGLSFVLDGPPGTGKSQTISNIIADALSVGKRVLFVSEKIAALEVVKRRLDDCGLGDFCLECHTKVSRKVVLEELKWCLEIPIETYPNANHRLNDLQKQRQALNDYVRILHQPKKPIGLSMYELHGYIARLTRKGMLGKSRVTFEKPESVTRFTHDSWVQLLRLAPQHQNVLSNFARHPWRGCHLTTQALALKSDIQSNFSLLAEQAAQLAQDLKPLEEEKLVPTGTTPLSLKCLLDTLEKSLTVPDIPATWFASPREISGALIDHHQASLQAHRLRQALSEYVDDVTARFSEDVLQLSDMRRFRWLERLSNPLPSICKECRDVLTEHSTNLRNFEAALSAFEQVLNQLVTELKLPLKSDLPIGSVAKLLAAARLISTEAPFRPVWFENERASEIVSAANEAIAKLTSLKEVEQSVVTRINPQELLKLTGDIEDIDEVKRSWELIASHASASQITNLERFAQQLTQEKERLSRVDADLQTLSSALQFTNDFEPTAEEARTIIEALPPLLAEGAYNGNWRDSATRARVKQRIEAALLDLSEAQELRGELESRFSHRAFLPTARTIVDQGKDFASLWKRLFGGYSKYRIEVADLYKSAVPDTRTLLRDLQQLATFHKRMGEVEQTFEELSEEMIPGVSADQMESWQRVIAAMTVFEAFISAVPHTARALPNGPVVIHLRPDDPLVVRLSEVLKPINASPTSISVDLPVLTPQRINAALGLISDLQLAVTRCCEAIRISGSRYQTPPDIEQLLRDIGLAKDYASDRRDVEALFAAQSAAFPIDAEPFELYAWHSAIDGVESANKLVKTFGASSILTDTVCTPGRLNQAALNGLTQATDNALQQVSTMWVEQIKFINLTPPDEQEIDPRRRTSSAIKTCVTAAASEFEDIASRLSSLLEVLKPGLTVPFDRLAQDAIAIQELRRAQGATDTCGRTLSQFGIEQPHELSNEELRVCEWIKQAPDNLLKSPLVQAIATSPQKRTQVAEILAKAKLESDRMYEPWEFLETVFNTAKNVSTGVVPKELTFCELPTFLQTLIASIALIDEWIQFNRWRKQMCDEGFATVVDELINQKYLPEEAVDAVSAKLYQQLFDHFSFQERQIWDFTSDRHEQIRERFQTLDTWEIKSAAARVREYQLSREDRPRIGWLAPMTSELGILKKETEKKRRHMPLRKLFNAVPGVLQRLKPCIMMSPLSVSTFLQSEALRFDLVIFDEASQVFPWDAIGAIYRGSQLIVAGDDKQLPPTSFFSRADIESEEEEDDIGDFESILSLCKSVNMPNKRLRWHYRSRREPLIAFSNRHFYDGDLVTFPSVRDAARDAVQLIPVPDGIWSDRKNLPEARRVAELVVEHFREKPDKSIGVIAFNISQQQAIEDAIYDLRRSSPVIDALLKEGPHEPLFIKNLENVQGDERDIILLSFGYAKNEAGKFIKNFGPVSKPGGERRLNVAVTRAREAVSLVASVRSSDMDLSGSTSIGAHLLKSYLEYAEHGVDAMSRSIVETQATCDSPFEEEVAAALIRHGLEPVPQVGCGGFRIDLALKHPAHPGLYCLGIECDGSTYHSSKTARDRDRIRQSILEGLGWRICRVWSTDWIRNPHLQIQRILSIYKQASAIPPDHGTNPASQPEREFEDLQPQYITEDVSKNPTYVNIEDVPKQHIINVSLRIVTRVGTVDWSELVSLTSRELGFARTGKKIRERIEAILHEQIRQSNLHRSGERVSIG